MGEAARLEWSTKEVSELTGLTFRQLDWAVRSGLLTPRMEGSGPGHARRWDEGDVADAKVLATMRELEVPAWVAKKLLPGYRSSPWRQGPGEFFIWIGERRSVEMGRYLPHADLRMSGWWINI